jgi:hypothetical protein
MLTVAEQHLIMTSKSAPNIASGCIFTPNNPTPAAEAGLGKLFLATYEFSRLTI